MNLTTFLCISGAMLALYGIKAVFICVIAYCIGSILSDIHDVINGPRNKK